MASLGLAGADGKPVGTIQLEGYHLITEAQYQELQEIHLIRTRAQLQIAQARDDAERAKAEAIQQIQNLVAQTELLADNLIGAAEAVDRRSKQMRVTSAHLEPLIAAARRFQEHKKKRSKLCAS